jgi:hypothetical protein
VRSTLYTVRPWSGTGDRSATAGPRCSSGIHDMTPIETGTPRAGLKLVGSVADRVALLGALVADPARAADVSREEAVALLIAIAPVREALRLAASVGSRTTEPEPTSEVELQGRMLTLAEVAERSGKSLRWWREHWRTEIPTATKKGRTRLVSAEELAEWAARK